MLLVVRGGNRGSFKSHVEVDLGPTGDDTSKEFVNNSWMTHDPSDTGSFGSPRGQDRRRAGTTGWWKTCVSPPLRPSSSTLGLDSDPP